MSLPVRTRPLLLCACCFVSWWQPRFVFCPRAHGDTQHCRKALHRAVQCTSDYPEHVCEVLLTMERTEGGAPPLSASGLESVPFAGWSQDYSLRTDCVRVQPLTWHSVIRALMALASESTSSRPSSESLWVQGGLSVMRPGTGFSSFFAVGKAALSAH